MGQANGDWVSWYIAFAESPLVIGYNPSSQFVNDLKTKPWHEVLAEPGLKLGRTDPKLDPKGALTVELLKRAEAFYSKPDLSQRIIGALDNPAQVLPRGNPRRAPSVGPARRWLLLLDRGRRCQDRGDQTS